MALKVNSKTAAVRVEVVLATSARHRHEATTYEAAYVYSVPEVLAEELLGLDYAGEPFFITPTEKHAEYPRKELGLEVLEQTEDVSKDDGGAPATNQGTGDEDGKDLQGSGTGSEIDTGSIQIT